MVNIEVKRDNYILTASGYDADLLVSGVISHAKASVEDKNIRYIYLSEPMRNSLLRVFHIYAQYMKEQTDAIQDGEKKEGEK